MFAINHAAAALVLKRRYPGVSLVWLLLSVQAMELLWVLLNALGVERSRTAAAVHSVQDIHLAYMPYSHSVLTTLLAAALLGGLAWWHSGRRTAFAAVGLGVLSHIVLDLLTHGADIALSPLAGSPLFGSGLYRHAPLAAFALELAFGVACWRAYRGRWALLAAIVGFNLANLSVFAAALAGPEALLAGRPGLLTAVVGVQIAVTLPLVAWLARKPVRGRAPGIHGRYAITP